MRSIESLPSARNRKRPGSATCRGLALLAVLVFWAWPAAVTAEVRMETRSGGAEIGRDPSTGDRIMRTPDPVPQETYQGPDTIIVAPEVYPGAVGSGPGNRPGGNRPDQVRPGHGGRDRPQADRPGYGPGKDRPGQGGKDRPGDRPGHGGKDRPGTGGKDKPGQGGKDRPGGKPEGVRPGTGGKDRPHGNRPGSGSPQGGKPSQSHARPR